MKRFLIFIALFFGLVFLANIALSALFDGLYNRMYTGQTGGELNAYLDLPKTPDLLIMGNSRARYQVIPDSFAIPTYSLCHAGMGQVFQTGLLEILAQENKLPKKILLHVDFGEYVSDDNTEDIGNLRYYYNQVPTITREINNISRYEKIKYLFSFYRYNGRIISTIKNYIQSRSALGSSNGNGYHEIQPVANDSVAFATLPAVLIQPRFHYQNLRHLLRFITVCQQHHVRLLCFTSPYFTRPPFASVAARPLDSLLRQQRIPYFNTSAQPLPVLTHHARFWQDNEHLNVLGAGYFSQQVATWVNPLVSEPATRPPSAATAAPQLQLAQ